MGIIKLHKHLGRTWTAKQLSVKFSISRSTINERLNRGLSVLQAIDKTRFTKWDYQQVSKEDYIKIHYSFIGESICLI